MSCPHHPHSDEAVLARNDRYQREVIEAHDLCPYARPARESGMVRTLLVRGPEPQQDLLTQLVTLQQSQDCDFEVALLIAPEYAGTAQQWERLVRELVDAASQAVSDLGKVPSLYGVAFHPDLTFSTGSPEQLIGLLRHSPDPTIQLVRASLMDRVRGNRSEVSYIDVSELPSPDDALAALTSLHHAKPLSQLIAEANYATWQRLAGELEATLAELHAHRHERSLGDDK